MTGEHDAAAIGLRRLVHGDIEPVGGEPAAGVLGPLYDGHRAWQEIVEAELGKVALLEPVEIAVLHRKARARISLHQREGRARHLTGNAEPHQQCPREARLAGAERSGERDQISRLQDKSEALGETIELDEVDAVKAPTRAHQARLDP